MSNRSVFTIMTCLFVLAMTVTMLCGCTTVTGNTIYKHDLPGKYDKGDK